MRACPKPKSAGAFAAEFTSRLGVAGATSLTLVAMRHIPARETRYAELCRPLVNLHLEMSTRHPQFRLQHELDLGAGIGDAQFEFTDATVMPEIT